MKRDVKSVPPDESPLPGTVRELLRGRSQILVTAGPNDTLRHVISTMKSLGISQLPVVEGGLLRGLVTEVAVLRKLVSGDGHFDAPIEEVLDTDYATVSPDSPVDALKSVLAGSRVALVAEGGALLGIVTKIDLIDYLSRRAGEAPVGGRDLG